MPYFRKRGNRWSFTIDIGVDPLTGKRKQKTSSGFATKKEAQLAVTQLEQELTAGAYVSDKTTTFKDFAPQWLELYQATGRVKPSTVVVRQAAVNRLLKHFSDIKLKDITTKMVQDMLVHLVKQGYAKQTVTIIYSTARLLFAKAVELERMKDNPASKAVIPFYNKTIEELECMVLLPKYLEKDELKHFLKVAHKRGLNKDYPAFLLLAYTGMRIGELCALKWKDIDCKECTVSITKTYWTKNNSTKDYVLLTPKTTSSKRLIAIDPFVVEALTQHQSAQNQLRMRKKDTYYDHDFVFAKMTHCCGYPERPEVFLKRMRRLLGFAGLSKSLSPHSLRHTHTSLLAEAGVSLEAIQERLGHKSDDVTRRIYLHITKTVKREASDKFHQLMEQ